MSRVRALALATAQAIKAADPNATVIAPATSGMPLDFLEALFQQGLLNDIDAVSVHPYRGNNPETAADDYQALRLLIHRYAPKGKDVPLISVGVGLLDGERLGAAAGAIPGAQWLSNLAEGIRLSIWYDWHDDGTDPKNGEHHFGTVRNDYAQAGVSGGADATRTLGRVSFPEAHPARLPRRLPVAVRPRAQRAKTGRVDDGARPRHFAARFAAAPVITDMLGQASAPTVVQGRLRLHSDGKPRSIWMSPRTRRCGRPPPGQCSRWTRSTRTVSPCGWR